MGTVRRQARIARSADDVWAVISDPLTIAQWFPGIVDATVDGTTRVVTTASGGETTRSRWAVTTTSTSDRSPNP